MTAEDIQKILENLGEKVSILAEENRVLQTRDDAGQQLISLLSNNINEEDWVKIYQSTDDVFIKEIMLDWGADLFPEGFVK
jgi:L-asparaginase/Glu-tRNA(Gln) amidotransferase subunit D|tara:strand:- start:199 stop:441 length:243 start_codon:yes stop_codon:yes gene_type:complete